MAMDQGVLSAIADAERNVPENVRALKSLFNVSDSALAAAFGTSRQTMNGRLNSTTRLGAGEVAGFAAFFRIPEGVLYMPKIEVLRWCLSHDDVGPPAPLPAPDTVNGDTGRYLICAGQPAFA